MTVMALAVTPRRALARDSAASGPSQQGLRRSPDEGGRSRRPIPRTRGRTRHTKAQLSAHATKAVLKLRLEPLPDHAPCAAVLKPLKLPQNPSVLSEEAPIRRLMQSVRARDELAPHVAERGADIIRRPGSRL
jgi:hypothetical protein